MAITAVRTNSVPVGGATAQQPVAPIGTMTPADIQALVDELIPAVARFRQESTPLAIPLSQVKWGGIGDSQPQKISSVGLGLRVESHHHLVFTVNNAIGGGTGVTLIPSHMFPFNLLLSTQIGVNGGAAVYSAGGFSDLLVSARTRRGFWIPKTKALGPQLNPAWCLVTITGAGVTVTNSAVTDVPMYLGGFKSVAITDTSTATITVDFMTVERLVLDDESALGALPLQNNSTYASIQRTLAPAFIGADETIPLFKSGGIPAGVTAAFVSGYTDALYVFDSVPSDAGLYQAMVSNSYQVQEQPSISVGSVGPQALAYNIPQNQYLVALHSWGVDGATTKVPIPFSTVGITGRQVSYNGGTIIPAIQRPWFAQERFYASYGGSLDDIPGYQLWDGDDTANSLTATDNMGWIDCYHVATPVLNADLAAGVAVPATFAITRECVVSGAVQVVGG